MTIISGLEYGSRAGPRARRRKAMRCGLTLLAATILCAVVTNPATASIIHEDTFYWVANGTAGGLGVDVFVNPPEPPVDAWVKIQETVFDDPQGKQILTDNLNTLIHGSPIPADPINLYIYSVTNLTYGNGPVIGGGNGVSGFNIVNQFATLALGIWGPNAAASWWDTPAGNSPFPANWEWDIDADMDGADGDGIGITQGQTFNGFMFAVPDGTPHGLVPAWVHTWSGGGLTEQPVSVQIDITVDGFVSGPVPEPATLLLLCIGGLVLLRRRSL
jgi:hypothetical protein